jgi:hypothetical protein
MAKLHISQDETGFWQMTFEDDDGKLTLVSHQFRSPEHLIQDARELVAKGKVPNAAIVIGPPRPPDVRAHGLGRPFSKPDRPYSKPAPRKAVD